MRFRERAVSVGQCPLQRVRPVLPATRGKNLWRTICLRHRSPSGALRRSEPVRVGCIRGWGCNLCPAEGDRMGTACRGVGLCSLFKKILRRSDQRRGSLRPYITIHTLHARTESLSTRPLFIAWLASDCRVRSLRLERRTPKEGRDEYHKRNNSDSILDGTRGGRTFAGSSQNSIWARVTATDSL
jgi:hypothetical protein